MGITRRATGVNLLNYIRQKNVVDNITIQHIQRRTYEGNEIDSKYFRDMQSWICIFKYQYDGKSFDYIDCAMSKKEATNFTLDKASNHLSKIIQYT